MQYDAGQYLLQYKDKIVKHKNNDDNTQVAVLVENRDAFFLPLVIKNTILKLGLEWNIHLFVTKAVMHYLQEHLPFCKLHFTVLELEGTFSIVEYSKLLCSKFFWEAIREEHVLIFQLDTIIFQSVPTWALQYDMIGAPCGELVEDKFTFNGGLSLRKKSTMLAVLARAEETEIDQHPEDVFTTRCLRKAGIYNLPDMFTCAQFSLESLLMERENEAKVFGMHGTTKYYLPRQYMKRILAKMKKL